MQESRLPKHVSPAHYYLAQAFHRKETDSLRLSGQWIGAFATMASQFPNVNDRLANVCRVTIALIAGDKSIGQFAPVQRKC